VEECRRFQEENAADLAAYDHPQWSAAELGGHDFWLTRNGHGAGFWTEPIACRKPPATT